MPLRPASLSRGGQPTTVLHYSHHSVGLGHLVRSLAVAGGLAERFRVVLCSGGPVPAGLRLPRGVELVQLPPIGLGHGGGLASLDPALTLERAWDRRRELLLSLRAALRPVVIVVELFPFGRAKFAREIVPLLESARRDPRPVTVISSVRDLLVTDKRDQQAHDDLAAVRLSRYFDGVIVHADERFARLEDTFRPSVRCSTPVLYSGFVCPGSQRPRRELRAPAEVLVSAGGGSCGAPLLRAAAETHRREFAPRGLRTRLVTGPFLAADEAARLQAQAARCSGLSVERFIPDLCQAMSGVAVSVSQCGYNTMLDVLRAGVPSVVVPYDDGRENEQSERARRLGRLGALKVLPAALLTPERLAEAVLDALDAQPRSLGLDLNGAANTAALVSDLVSAARHERGRRVA